jgi:hypothetical protein
MLARAGRVANRWVTLVVVESHCHVSRLQVPTTQLPSRHRLGPKSRELATVPVFTGYAVLRANIHNRVTRRQPDKCDECCF